VSQIRAAELAAGTEELALVSPLPQSGHDSRARGLPMVAVLLEDQPELLANELRPPVPRR
jgi:hypothetical protein